MTTLAPWDLASLSLPPAFVESPEHSSSGVRAVFYETLPWKGNPTRAFAYLAIPEVRTGQRVPAIVLVHGGGGSAFISWVQLWASRGYAAIAMDTCGCVSGGGHDNHTRHDMGGPPGWGGFEQMTAPLRDQWSYHAVADVILAHSLIRSFPEVDESRVGLTGISWGGYLTILAASVDHRFRFAAPVYGCGFYEDSGLWNEALKTNSVEQLQAWRAQWDPAVYLSRASIPILWLTGTNDFAFSLRSLRRSYLLPKGARTLSIHLRMPHGHGGPGENPPEIHTFANSYLKGETPLAMITKSERASREVTVTFRSETSIVSSELLYTKDAGPWTDRHWECIAARLGPNTATADLPPGTTVYCINITDDRGLLVSSDLMELPHD